MSDSLFSFTQESRRLKLERHGGLLYVLLNGPGGHFVSMCREDAISLAYAVLKEFGPQAYEAKDENHSAQDDGS